MKFHLILTLDYELFGNGSGCIRHCIVEPVKRLLEITARHGAPVTFFVDALEFDVISREFEKGALPDTYDAFPELEEQLRDLGSSSNSIQLHLHPQWLNATYADGSWQLDYDLWRIGDLASERIDDAVSRGIAYLSKFCSRKSIDTFRAGGWAIQPSARVLASLRRQGIERDSTVAPGLINRSRGEWFDFRQTPPHPFWPVVDNVCVLCDSPQNDFLEMPIATANIGKEAHIKALWEHRKGPVFPPGCNGSYAGPSGPLDAWRAKLGKLLQLGTVMLDYSTLPAWALSEATRIYMDRFADCEHPVPMVAIGHNKNFSRRAEENLDAWLDWVAAQRDIEFSSFDQWATIVREAG